MKKLIVALAVVVVACAALGTLAVSARAAAPIGHFTDLGDGTVRDNLTTLVWQQGTSPWPVYAAEPAAYCATLAVPSGGWRLPTVAELQTLLDETVSRPSIDTTYFPGTPLEYFWTASSVAGYPAATWTVSFHDGSVYPGGAPMVRNRVRCVR